MFKFELMVDYKLQEEDKQRRAEAERIMVDNQKKIEEQQRKMVSTFAKVEFTAGYTKNDLSPSKILPFSNKTITKYQELSKV